MAIATWLEFAAAAPDLAAFGAQRLAGRVAYLATLRADGAPRLHPVTPHIVQSHLFVYMDPASPKVRDLRRDGRYALHCAVEDTSGGEGEFSCHGQATLVDDLALRAVLFDAARVAGFHPQDRYVVFELKIEGVLSTQYAGDQPIRNRWSVSPVA